MGPATGTSRSSEATKGARCAPLRTPPAAPLPRFPASPPLPIHPLDLGSKGAQSLVNPFEAPLDLADIVNGAGAFGGQRRQQHGHAGTDIGRLYRPALERGWAR